MAPNRRRKFEQFEEAVRRIIYDTFHDTYDCIINMAEKNQSGYDLKVYMKKNSQVTRVIAVQCKCHIRPVHKGYVEKFISYMKTWNAQNEFDEGWMISASGYSESAIKLAKEENNSKVSLGTIKIDEIHWNKTKDDGYLNTYNFTLSDSSKYNFSSDSDKDSKSSDKNLARYCYIGVFANKGGTGKTTIAAHLAGGFALMGHDVILLDVDPQRNLKKLFQDQDGAFIFVKPIQSGKTGSVIDVLDEKEWEEEKENYANIKVVVCDCNPTFEENPIELIKEFDYCVIPTSLSPLGISKSGDVIKRTFDKIRTENKKTEMDVLINYYDESKGKAKRTELLLDLVKNEIPFDENNNLYLIDPIKICAIHRSDSLFYWGMHIVEKRKPELAFNNGPTSRVREDFLKLAEYFLKKIK